MADALRKFKGKIELLDVSERLPGLKRVKGAADWKLQGMDEDKKWHWFSRYEEVPETMHKRLKASMFAQDDCKEMGLDRWYVLGTVFNGRSMRMEWQHIRPMSPRIFGEILDLSNKLKNG